LSPMQNDTISMNGW